MNMENDNKNKKTNVIQEKSYLFSIRIINLYKHLIKTHKEYNLSGQVLRSGTSIGANVEESIGGSSRKDFTSKIQISYREARETNYWLRLLRDTQFIEDKLTNSLINDCDELIKILSSIRKTTLNYS